MVVYMRLKSGGTTFVFGVYDSQAEAERVCNILKVLNDAWEFHL